MTIRTAAAVAAVAVLGPALAHAQTKNVDKPFVSGGKVMIQLEGGDYEVRAAADNHVRVTLTGNTGNTTVDVAIAGRQATASVKNTPHTNFKCVIEVPKAADLVIRLTGGDLDVAAITGNKDIEATAGDVDIAAGSPNDYASVDASVKVGDLSPGPFGEAKGSFLSKSVNWTGKGKYKLHATLGAGDLKLK
jgi:hypothetical protein